MSQPRPKNTPFWLLLIGIFLILTSKHLLTEGMFLDGVTYAGISRNMAEGTGTFWNPFYTQTLYPEFRQHPPLALGLEALAFRMLGDHWWVEKLYSLQTILLSGLLIALIWRRTSNDGSTAWLPLLFWISIPLVSWCTTNNLLENTMSVFVLLSVYIIIIRYQQNNRLWLPLAGASLLLAFLTKGFTGLFPLVFPIIYCTVEQERKVLQGIIDSAWLLVSIVGLTALMFWVFPSSLPYLKDYFSIQVLGNGLHEVTTSTRFFIVFQLLIQSAIPFAIIAILFILRKILKQNHIGIFGNPSNKTWFVTFLVLGLTGVLPMMVSVKQRDFYMLAALPFLALAFGHLTCTITNTCVLKIKAVGRNWMTFFASMVLIVGLFINFSQIGKYGRDEAFLMEMKKALVEIPEHEIISISQEDYTQWTWHAYFMRYGKVSLDDRQSHTYIFSYHPR